MKKYIVLLAVVMLSLLLLTACGCEHDWKKATCDEPMVCNKCGEVAGDPLGHDYSGATCEKPETCEDCGKTKGEALGHTWVDATCEKAKTCSACQKTEGEALGHDADAATCDKDSVCDTCQKVIEKAKGHSWTDATCAAPKTCSVCKKTEGEALAHDAPAATCETASVCKNCQKEIAPALNHLWERPNDCSVASTCSICHKSADDAKEHNWAAATTEKPKTCTVCGKTEGEPLEKPVVSETNLGITVNDLVSGINTTFPNLGYKLAYLGEEDGYIAYNVVPVDSAQPSPNVQILIYPDATGTYVLAVEAGTDTASNNTSATVTGNCLGLVAVLVDNTFGQADLTALQNNVAIVGNVAVYSHTKNGVEYMMTLTQTSATEAMLVISVAPAE